MEELRSRSDNFNPKPSSKSVRDLFMVGPPPINEDAIVHLPHNDDTGSSQESDFESKSLLKVQSEASAKTRKKMSFIITVIDGISYTGLSIGFLIQLYMVVIFLFTIHTSQRVPKVEKRLNRTNMPLLTQRSNRTFPRMNREQKGFANKFSQQNIQKQKLQLSQKNSSKAVFQKSKDLRLAVNL